MKNLDDSVSFLRGVLKCTAFFLLVFALVPVALLYKRMRPSDPFRISKTFHRTLLLLLGIRVRVRGKVTDKSPVLFVSNHTSYLDIIVLGASIPAGFVAKAEVSDWPLFGFLSKIQNTVFVERRAARAATQREQLRAYLAGGQNLILFPEGTSSVGFEVLPFKSSLFSIVEESIDEKTIAVQPISITCIEMGGFPMLREDRSLYAWYGDMTFAPHLWNVFCGDGFTVEIVFHEPLLMAAYPGRKELAAACHAAVSRGVQESLAHEYLRGDSHSH